ncbi:LbtU family siderophore porin [Endothiovibrio diazotrophicus]
MIKKSVAVAVVAALGGQGVALADGAPAGGAVSDRLQRMEQRMEYLEERVASQEREILAREQRIAELEGTSSSAGPGPWWQGVEMGGTVEVEASHTDNDGFGGSDASDIAVATVELTIDATVNDWTRANLTLLYEEDDTPLGVDAATITFGNPQVSPIYFTAGHMAVPFGHFDSHMVSDPFTLELGETYETVAQLGFARNGAYGSAWLFNGDQDDGEDRINDLGLNLGYAWEGEQLSGDLGFSYTSNLADSDTVSDYLDDNVGLGGTIRDNVAGYGVHATLASGPFSFIGEYVTAADAFDRTEMQFNGGGAEPSAWNLEAGYTFALAGRESTFAVGYQETDEAIALGLPKRRTSLGLSVAMREDTTLSFEWAHDEDYDPGDGDAVTGAAGSGEDADTVTVQLAVEF